MENIKLINKQLIQYYGTIPDGRPKFRIVWANDEVEVQIRNWITTPSGVLIPGNGAVKVKKYSGDDYYDRFILEQLEYIPNSEIAGSENGHYEPKWVFRSHADCGHKSEGEVFKCKGDFQRPIWVAVKLIVDSILTSHSLHLTKRDFDNRDKDDQEKEVMDTYDQLDDGYIGRMATMGEAVFVHRDKDFVGEG